MITEGFGFGTYDVVTRSVLHRLQLCPRVAIPALLRKH